MQSDQQKPAVNIMTRSDNHKLPLPRQNSFGTSRKSKIYVTPSPPEEDPFADIPPPEIKEPSSQKTHLAITKPLNVQTDAKYLKTPEFSKRILCCSPIQTNHKEHDVALLEQTFGIDKKLVTTSVPKQILHDPNDLGLLD